MAFFKKLCIINIFFVIGWGTCTLMDVQYVAYLHCTPVLSTPVVYFAHSTIVHLALFTRPETLWIFSLLQDFLPPRRLRQTLQWDRHFGCVICFIHRRDPERGGDREGERVFISSELPGVIPLYCMCPDPETSRIPMPPRRLALKTQPPSPQAHTHSFPPGDCG